MKNNALETALEFLTTSSIETTPNVYAKYGQFTDLVSHPKLRHLSSNFHRLKSYSVMPKIHKSLRSTIITRLSSL